MTTSYAQRGAEQPSFDELETTEPDLRLANIDLLPDEDDDQDSAVAFMEAKTEPARPIDGWLRDEQPGPSSERPSERRRASAARDEALLAFLETVRRVFGANS